MKHDMRAGTTDYTVLVLLRDSAGAPKTGLAHTDIDLAYAVVEVDNDVTTADVAPASLSALTDAHTDWGFKEVNSGDHPGLYRLDIADAVFAAGLYSSVVTVTGATISACSIEFTFGMNVTGWGHGAVATPTVTGVPEVDLTHRLGSAVSGAELTAATLGDAMWSATAASNNTAGTMGRLLNIIGRIFQ